MLVNRTPMKFPDIRFIFSHSGGALTVLAARIIDDLPRTSKTSTSGASDERVQKVLLRNRTRLPASRSRRLKDVAPVSQILFGSDVPIRAYDLTTTGLDEYQGFSPSDWRAINRGNAERLWPRFKT